MDGRSVFQMEALVISSCPLIRFFTSLASTMGSLAMGHGLFWFFNSLSNTMQSLGFFLPLLLFILLFFNHPGALMFRSSSFLALNEQRKRATKSTANLPRHTHPSVQDFKGTTPKCPNSHNFPSPTDIPSPTTPSLLPVPPILVLFQTLP